MTATADMRTDRRPVLGSLAKPVWKAVGGALTERYAARRAAQAIQQRTDLHVKILLDTHILLWWMAHDRRLPRPARLAIEDPANRIFVSIASLWENGDQVYA